MKCPYNNFNECYKTECPAYVPPITNSDGHQKRKDGCSYIMHGVQPPNIANITNNYYTKGD